MAEAKISIFQTDVRALKYENSMTTKSGDPMKLEFKSGTAIKVNPSNPTAALVLVKLEAADEEKNMVFEIETATAVASDTPLENLEEIVRKNYMPHIMLAVNEKIRMTAMVLGLAITPPSLVFEYKD